MAWTKIPQEHHPLFAAAVPDDSRVETLRMFGGVAALVNGHMFGGLWAETAVVRLAEAEREEVLAMAGASVFDPMGNGRTMRDMVVLPAGVFRDNASLRAWLDKALAYTATLPPKPKKQPKAGRGDAPAAKPPSAKKAPAKKAPAKKKAPASDPAPKRPAAKKAPSAKKARKR
jgi:TfoX/Sxy family transcriptional regulator of competence genes